MDFDIEYNNLIQKGNRFLFIAKCCGGIGLAFIVCCILELAFSLIPLFATVCLIPAAICCFLAVQCHKNAETLGREHNENRIADKEEEYENNRVTAQEGYSEICVAMKKPEAPNIINVLNFESIHELGECQNEGEYWNACLKECECWLDIKCEESGIGAFCIIETYENFDKKVRQIPGFYTSTEESAAQVWWRYIPIHDIVSYEVVGEVLQTSSITGGNSTYRGITINGVEFGELEYDPIEIEHKTHDNRVVVLSYYDGIEKTILFPFESLGMLRMLIPQFER